MCTGAAVEDAHRVQLRADDALHGRLLFRGRFVRGLVCGGRFHFRSLFGLAAGDLLLVGHEGFGDDLVHAGRGRQLQGLARVDLFDDGVDLGQERGDELDAPGLHGLLHDGVVRVGKGLLRDGEGPCQSPRPPCRAGG